MLDLTLESRGDSRQMAAEKVSLLRAKALPRYLLWPPHATPEAIVTALLEVRRHHPTWGAKKLLKVVSTRQPAWTLPARSTVCDRLDRAGLITAPRRRQVPAHPGRPLMPMTAPNGTWTADFKGQFKTRNGVYCYPLTIVDGIAPGRGDAPLQRFPYVHVLLK